MTREEFRQMTEKGITIYDGATGSWLMAHGMPKGVCPEEWIKDHPDVLKELQRGYVEAGSQILIVPTFGANRERLKGYHKDGEITALNTENVKSSKEAAAGKALVAGDISMTGLIIYPDDDESFDEAVDVYKEQAQILVDAGVDLFAVETMISLEDARAAVHAIREICDLPVMVTLSFEANGRTLYGDLPENAAQVLTEEGADAVGINCSTGPDKVLPLIEAMRKATDLPLIAKPNAGLPTPQADGSVTYDMSEEDFAEHMKALVAAGACIVGGCCGTTPAYIEKLVQTVKG